MNTPRIYVYKITFLEVPYYYYGAHKEKVFDEYYMGSPDSDKTKWCWEFYTPKKQILQLFSNNEKGWREAQNIEYRIIKSFYRTDKWCLNLHCGATMSIEQRSKNAATTNAQKWQCTVTGIITNPGRLSQIQRSKGIDTFKRIKVDGPRGWEITFEDGRVIVITISLKEWAKENGYSYSCLLSVRSGRNKKHKDIIKVVAF